jgi:hypothetical protein
MRDYPAVRISLLLLNRIVSFVDEGVDLASARAAAGFLLRAIQWAPRGRGGAPAYLAGPRRAG